MREYLLAAALVGQIYQFGPCTLAKIDYDRHAEARTWFAACVKDAARINHVPPPAMPQAGTPSAVPAPAAPQSSWARAAIGGMK